MPEGCLELATGLLRQRAPLPARPSGGEHFSRGTRPRSDGERRPTRVSRRDKQGESCTSTTRRCGCGAAGDPPSRFGYFFLHESPQRRAFNMNLRALLRPICLVLGHRCVCHYRRVQGQHYCRVCGMNFLG
jgi:hypothetical protein